ncbi:hypothetical protein SDC9_133469 [bioreactor metagenome]|uniref:Uncharacterized protein n=1 Tax=bioreactor metagenome TaxID=1076179 RepID=A0A645DAA7_9ZZZZ
MHQAGLDAMEHAQRGDRRGVAALAFQADDMVGLHRHIAHIAGGGVDIFRRDVAAVETLHKAPQRPEVGLALQLGRVADQHRFAAAQVEPGGRGFIAHAPCQAQAVDQRVFFVGIVPQTGAAQGRPQQRIMEDRDALEARCGVVKMHHLLISMFLHVIEDLKIAHNILQYVDYGHIVSDVWGCLQGFARKCFFIAFFAHISYAVYG